MLEKLRLWLDMQWYKIRSLTARVKHYVYLTEELYQIAENYRWRNICIDRDMRKLRTDLTEEIRAANEISLDIHPDAQNTNFVILLGRHGKELSVRSRNISQEEFDALFETLNKKKS